MAKETGPQTVRVPLVGTFNQRPATAGAFLTGKDQRFVNFIPFKKMNPLTEKPTYACVKRPGFEAYSTPAAVAATALHVFEGTGSGTTLISAFGATTSTIYENTTSKGALAANSRVRGFIETNMSGTATVVMACNDSRAYYYPVGGAVTEITDTDYPGKASRTTVGNFVELDGYLFIMDTTGRIYNSDINSITAWTSTSYQTPTLYPANGVGLARHRDSVVAFTKSSVEFYNNVGAPLGSVLGRRDSQVHSVGGVLPAGVGVTHLQVEDEVYFIGVSRTGSAGIYRIKNFEIEKVSTFVLDAQLEVFGAQNATLTHGKWWGRKHLIVHAGQSFALNIDDNIWWEFAAGIGTFMFAGSSHGDALLFAVSSTDTNGKIYKLNTSTPVYQDNAVAYTGTIQTSKLDFDSEARKRFHFVKLIGNEEASTTTVGISWSDDDYQTFTTERNVDMSAARAYLANCGMARRRAFKLTSATNTPCYIEAIELVISGMTK